MSTNNEITSMLDLLAEQLSNETVAELIQIYAQNSSQQIVKLTTALNEKDLPTLAAVAHSLKSSSGNMGATELQSNCLKLEKSTVIGAETQKLLELITALQHQALVAMSAWKPKT
jgi:HPt (histidine-containing phosphotransfer) domain-containing protein